MGNENDMFLVSGSKISAVFCRGIEIDLMLKWGSKLLDFSDGVEIDLVFVWRF